MVLSPRIKVELTEFQRNIVSGLEGRIDAHIKTHFSGKEDGVVKVDISDYSISEVYSNNFNDKVRDVVVRLYESAGWDVKYLTDKKGREQFIELTPKNRKT